jgi:hypothetical protein
LRLLRYRAAGRTIDELAVQREYPEEGANVVPRGTDPGPACVAAHARWDRSRS